MTQTTTRARRGFGRHTLALVVAAAAIVPACTMKKQEAPELTGPSEFATSVSVGAAPDVITQDGASQSVITVLVRGVNGAPVSGVPLRVEVAVNGVLVNGFGRLAATNLVTGSDGRATTIYTAPSPPPDLNEPEPVVQILATPIGTDYANAVARFASIRLVRPTVVQPPGSPFAEFTYSPATPRVAGQVHFDGRLSYDLDGVIVLYEWDYGDGDRETGETQQHDFVAEGSYGVTLTVTDNSGLKSSRTRIITVVP